MPKLPLLLLCLTIGASACSTPRPNDKLAGDWDVYIALSAKPKFGFEGWRRMGYAHFAGSDSANVGWLRRRTGDTILNATTVVGERGLRRADAGRRCRVARGLAR